VADAICLPELDSGLSEPRADTVSLWDLMDSELDLLKERAEDGSAVGVPFSGDWSAVACDFWVYSISSFRRGLYRAAVPLNCVVYHDSVIAVSPSDPQSPSYSLLHLLLRLSLPLVTAPPGNIGTEDSVQVMQRNAEILGRLHCLSFAAFLSEHRFLTPDFKVEEARYTNGAYILINQSETDGYETERVSLPALGFYVEHPQMTAHDALRVGNEPFTTRAFRIARSQDEKPLLESRDVLRQEFPV
jgi:hypothetical protein